MQKTSRFNRSDARRFYNRFGGMQDRQGFYEDAALSALIEHGDFSHAQSVFELGCGTGRLAARLLAEHLPPSARYVATDISETMVRLAKEKLEPWAERSAVHLSSGELEFSSYGGPFARFVSTYVLDLLSPDEIAETFRAARTSVQTGGLLCTAGLTYGTDLLSSTTSRVWDLVHTIKPSLVGGCRPRVLSDLIPQTYWRILYREVVVSSAIPSEVLVAEAVPSAGFR
jgi:SAM-dependent methyltransferase